MPRTLEQRYEKAKKMVGVMPIGRANEQDEENVALFWSLRTDAYPTWKADGLDKSYGDTKQCFEAESSVNQKRHPKICFFKLK